MNKLEFENVRMGLPVWAKQGKGWAKATVVKVESPSRIKCALHFAGRKQTSGYRSLEQLAPRDKEQCGEDKPA
jgi:hypothetical protein